MFEALLILAVAIVLIKHLGRGTKSTNSFAKKKFHELYDPGNLVHPFNEFNK